MNLELTRRAFSSPVSACELGAVAEPTMHKPLSEASPVPVGSLAAALTALPDLRRP